MNNSLCQHVSHIGCELRNPARFTSSPPFFRLDHDSVLPLSPENFVRLLQNVRMSARHPRRRQHDPTSTRSSARVASSDVAVSLSAPMIERSIFAIPAHTPRASRFSARDATAPARDELHRTRNLLVSHRRMRAKIDKCGAVSFLIPTWHRRNCCR